MLAVSRATCDVEDRKDSCTVTSMKASSRDDSGVGRWEIWVLARWFLLREVMMEV